MNTPKLISILSSTTGNVDPSRNSRATDPVHGLDFSQLLGERRSQVSAPTPGPRPTQNDSRSRAVADSNTSSQPPASSTPAPQNHARQDTTPSNAAAPAPARQAENTNTTSPETNPPAASRHTEASSASANSQPDAGNDTAIAAPQPAEPPVAEGGTVDIDAQLAQNAAEAGLAVLITGAGPQAAAEATALETTVLDAPLNKPAEAGAQAASRQAHLAVANPLPSAAPAPVATVVAAAPDTTALQAGIQPAVQAGAELQAAQATPVAQPGTAALAAALPDQAPVATSTPAAAATTQPLAAASVLVNIEPETSVAANALPAGHQAPAPQAAAAPVVATAPTLPAALAQALRGNDVAAGPMPVADTPESPAAIRLADTPLPMAVAIDPAGSAAARSLQDFTAMVAAARATSGTVLAPSAFAGGPQSGLPLNPAAMAGLVPTGMFPGQALPAALPLAGVINTPLGSPQWATELGRQFVSIAQAGKGLGQVAELRLDPPELGPLRITINLNDNVAHAIFSSPHAGVRQTVENALPQLQQMLEQAGISLGQTNVNDQHQSDGQAFQQAGRNGLPAGTAGGGESVELAGNSVTGRPADPNALVDTFA